MRRIAVTLEVIVIVYVLGSQVTRHYGLRSKPVAESALYGVLRYGVSNITASNLGQTIRAIGNCSSLIGTPA